MASSSSTAAVWHSKDVTPFLCSPYPCSGSARHVPGYSRLTTKVNLPLAGKSSALSFRRHERMEIVQATTDQASNVVESSNQDTNDDEVCELVNRLNLTLGDANNSFNAYLVKAMKNNNGAAVLLLSDVFGYNDEATRDFAYRLSCFGYNVLVPDLFRGEPWSHNSPKSGYEDWRDKHPPERVADDINTAAQWLIEEINEAGVPKKLGLLGFCFGGGRVLEAIARDEAKQYATAVSFYPTRFDAALATQINVPLLLISGNKDELCSIDTLKMFARNSNSEVRIYSGRGHAFAHRPSSSEEDDDAEDAFLTMKSWLHDHLLSS